jgi:hypothetical protein
MSVPCGQSPATNIQTSPKSVTNPESEFALFPNLALELRLKIWKIASFEHRNVDIWSINHVGASNAWDLVAKGPRWHSSTAPPAVLHVNQESRTECLKFYTLSFGIERTANNFTLPLKSTSIGARTESAS